MEITEHKEKLKINGRGLCNLYSCINRKLSVQNFLAALTGLLLFAEIIFLSLIIENDYLELNNTDSLFSCIKADLAITCADILCNMWAAPYDYDGNIRDGAKTLKSFWFLLPVMIHTLFNVAIYVFRHIYLIYGDRNSYIIAIYTLGLLSLLFTLIRWSLTIPQIILKCIKKRYRHFPEEIFYKMDIRIKHKKDQIQMRKCKICNPDWSTKMSGFPNCENHLRNFIRNSSLRKIITDFGIKYYEANIIETSNKKYIKIKIWLEKIEGNIEINALSRTKNFINLNSLLWINKNGIPQISNFENRTVIDKISTQKILNSFFSSQHSAFMRHTISPIREPRCYDEKFNLFSMNLRIGTANYFLNKEIVYCHIMDIVFSLKYDLKRNTICLFNKPFPQFISEDRFAFTMIDNSTFCMFDLLDEEEEPIFEKKFDFYFTSENPFAQVYPGVVRIFNQYLFSNARRIIL